MKNFNFDQSDLLTLANNEFNIDSLVYRDYTKEEIEDWRKYPHKKPS